MFDSIIAKMDRNKAAFAKLLVESYYCTGIGNIRKALFALLTDVAYGVFCSSAYTFELCFKALPTSMRNMKEFYMGVGYGKSEGWFSDEGGYITFR